jgi:trans-aconitate methyltransferase
MTTMAVQTLTGGSKAQVAEVDIPDSLRVLGPREAVPSGHCLVRVLTPEDGDQRIVWNGTSLVEINDAKKLFDDLVGQGLVPYKVGLGGRASAEVMQEFDPAAEEVIFCPVNRVVGG